MAQKTPHDGGVDQVTFLKIRSFGEYAFMDRQAGIP
jgi:hypothetical protein